MIIKAVEINVLVDGGFTGCPQKNWLKKMIKQVLVAQGIPTRRSVCPPSLRDYARRVLWRTSVDAKAELSLVITDQEKIHQLNLVYLEEDRPTDVLSFPMLAESRSKYGINSPFVTAPDGKKHLGEVIISYPQAIIQAEEHHHSVEREIAILIIHGVLHLLGYDHKKVGPEKEMRARETEILDSLEEALE